MSFRSPVLRRSGAVLLASWLLLAAAACSDDDSDATDDQDATTTTAATESDDTEETGDPEVPGELSFELVEAALGDHLDDYSECVVIRWDENSTGVDEEYRDAVTFFRQLDCSEDEQQADFGIPARVQIVNYVEFSDEETAAAFAEDESVLRQVIVDGPRAVSLSRGFAQTGVDAYREEILAACGCGEVLGENPDPSEDEGA